MAHIVLVHGGFAGGWCWKNIKKILEHSNHEVFTPTLSGLGQHHHLNSSLIDLNTHITDIKNVIEFEELQEVILLGHSYAGLVITGVASLIPHHIKKLVYLDALIPDNGDSLLTLVDSETANFFTQQAQQKGFGWQIPPVELIDNDYKDKDKARSFTNRFTPQPFASFSQKLFFSTEALGKIPKTYIHCIKNTHPALQKMKAKAQLIECKYLEINSTHFPMIDDGPELASLLLSVINEST